MRRQNYGKPGRGWKKEEASGCGEECQLQSWTHIQWAYTFVDNTKGENWEEKWSEVNRKEDQQTSSCVSWEQCAGWTHVAFL